MAKKILLKAAAKELGVSEYFLRTEVRAGRLPFIKTGNRYLFDLELLNVYLNRKAIQNMKTEDNTLAEPLHPAL